MQYDVLLRHGHQGHDLRVHVLDRHAVLHVPTLLCVRPVIKPINTALQHHGRSL